MDNSVIVDKAFLTSISHQICHNYTKKKFKKKKKKKKPTYHTDIEWKETLSIICNENMEITLPL